MLLSIPYRAGSIITNICKNLHKSKTSRSVKKKNPVKYINGWVSIPNYIEKHPQKICKQGIICIISNKGLFALDLSSVTNRFKVLISQRYLTEPVQSTMGYIENRPFWFGSHVLCVYDKFPRFSISVFKSVLRSTNLLKGLSLCPNQSVGRRVVPVCKGRYICNITK